MLKRFALGLLIFLAINLASAHPASVYGLMAVFGQDTCTDESEACPRRMAPPVLRGGGFDYRNEFQFDRMALAS